MAVVSPFGALRFTEKAGSTQELVCPPYDIVSEDERKAYLAKNSRNIIRLELPREGDDPYAAAGETLRSWLEDGSLAADSELAFYIYEEDFALPGAETGARKKIKGLVCRVKLEPFEAGVVLPHEETLSKAKTDRLNLMKATNCNFSSIYSLYFDENRSISARVEKLSNRKPDMEFTSGDGIIHRVWSVTDEAETAAISKAFTEKKLYIADGHHRYETGLNYLKWLRESNTIEDSHPAASIMMTLVDMENEGLVVFPTHRIIRDVEGFDAEKLLQGCEKYFTVEAADGKEYQSKLDEAAQKGKKAFALYVGGKTWLLTLREASVMVELLPGLSAACRQLDVTILHTLILERILGIDKENMANQKNLIYTRDPAEAMNAVDSGTANCAFMINPTKVEEIAAVAGAGEKMPQKSTYFYPKLITGHIMNPLA